MNRDRERAEPFLKHSSDDSYEKGRCLPGNARRVAAAIAAIMLIVNTRSTLAKADCDWGHGVAENSKCFLRQFPCLDSYFGIDHPPNYPHALKCFEADKQSLGFVALMYFNGEGTPRDLEKAEAALKAGQKTEPYSFSYEPLEKALDACRSKASAPCPIALHYCDELALSTFDMEVCSALDDIKAEAGLSHTIASIAGPLDARDREMLDRAFRQFEAYEQAEDGREYDEYIEGTVRSLAGEEQQEFVRENFEKLLREALQTHQLEPVCPKMTQEAQQEVELKYRGDIRKKTAQWMEEIASDKIALRERTQMINDYRKDAADSQRYWSKYQTLMAELASSLYQKQDNACDYAAGMKLAIAKNRIAELRFNPIGPQDEN